jgi:serine/threonine protein kinase
VRAGAVIAEKYELIDAIGEGGMGAVWRARHRELGRTVALKFVLGEEPSESAIERFLREARSAAKVRHRNVVDVLDFGRGKDGLPYLAMECLEGESLDARLKRLPPATLAEIVLWMQGALSGLAAIHDAGIVHRDLKPANIFLSRDADGVVPKVLDFGIARTAEGSASPLTHSMQTLGTPHYMSPEQVRSAKSVDLRSDVYAMGVILYQALTGKLPFEGPSATAVIAAIVTDDPDRVETLRPDVPRGVATVIHRAMARDPNKRFANARELREALVRASTGANVDSAPSIDIGASDTVLADSPFPGDRTPRTDRTPRADPLPTPKRTTRRGFFAVFAALSMFAIGAIGVGTFGELRDGSSPATTSAVPPPPPPIAPTTPAGVPRELVSISGSLAELAVRLRAFDRETMSHVRFAHAGESIALVADASDAGDVRRLLGDRSADGAAPEGDVLTPMLVRTTVRSNLRESPAETAALIGTLTSNTVLVAVYGAIEGSTSVDAGRGSWTRVVVAEGLEGWVASGLLAPESRCVPSIETIGGARISVAGVTLVVDGAEERALALFDRGGPRTPSTIRIALPQAACGTVHDLARLSLPSRLEIVDYFFTRTAPEGTTLVAIGTMPRGDHPEDGLTEWSIRTLEDVDTVVWERGLHSGENLPEARRDVIGGAFEEGPDGVHGFFPIRVRERRTRTFYVWEETTLVPYVPVVPTPEAPTAE